MPLFTYQICKNQGDETKEENQNTAPRFGEGGTIPVLSCAPSLYANYDDLFGCYVRTSQVPLKSSRHRAPGWHSWFSDGLLAWLKS